MCRKGTGTAGSSEQLETGKETLWLQHLYCVQEKNYELHFLCISAIQFDYHYAGKMGGSGQNGDLHATQTFLIAVQAS